MSLSYNEKGNFRGIATIIFKSSKNAVAAVEKYNNAPIDGGSSKLKLELVIDPSKKPLAARITANKPAAVAAPAKGTKAAKATKVAQGKKEQLKEKLKEKRKQIQKKKAAAKPKKPVKKTAEQLDQEMSDYFKN